MKSTLPHPKLILAFALGLLALLLALPAAPLTSYQLDVGGAGDAPFISGVGMPSSVGEVSYRWTDGDASLRLPAMDTAAPMLLRIRSGDNWRPDPAPLTMTLRLHGKVVGETRLAAGWNWYSYTLAPADLGNGLDLRIQSATFTDVNGVNHLGLPLDAIEVASLDPAPPPDWWLPLTLALAVILAAMLAMLRWGWRGMLAAAGLAMVVLLPALYLLRPLFALYIVALLAALCTALAVALFTRGRGRKARGGNVEVWLFVTALAVYLLLTPGQFSSDDDKVKYLATESLLLRHSLVLPVSVYDSNFSKYGLGQSLAQAPFIGAAMLVERAVGHPLPALRELSVMLLNPLLGALTVLLLYRTALLLYRRPRLALALALMGGGCTTIFAYALLTSTEMLLATLLLALAYTLLRAEGASDDTAAHTWLARAGLLLAALALTKEEYTLVGLVVIGWWLVRAYRHAPAKPQTSNLKPQTLLLLPLLLATAANIGYNLLRTGDLLNPGYTASAFVLPSPSAELTGIYGMLASSGKSLFLYSPPLILLCWSARRFYQRWPSFSLLWGMVSLLLLLFYARLSFWSGDLAWGPRYIMPLTPLLVLPLGVLLADFEAWGRVRRVAFVTLLGAGGAVQLLSALVSFQAAFFGGHNLPDLAAHYSEWQFIPWQSPLVQMSAMLLHGQMVAPLVTHLSSYGLPLWADYLAPALLLSPAVWAGGRLRANLQAVKVEAAHPARTAPLIIPAVATGKHSPRPATNR